MRFKTHENYFINHYKSPFTESFCISAIKRFKGFVNKKPIRDQFAKVTQLEKSSEKGKDVQFRKDFRNSYVTAYYPTKDGQAC